MTTTEKPNQATHVVAEKAAVKSIDMLQQKLDCLKRGFRGSERDRP